MSENGGPSSLSITVSTLVSEAVESTEELVCLSVFGEFVQAKNNTEVVMNIIILFVMFVSSYNWA